MKRRRIVRLPHLSFIYFRAHKMSGLWTVMFMAGAAVMFTTLILVDADSTGECLQDSRDVSLYKNAVPLTVSRGFESSGSG
jgi:hypothetical protein